MYLFYTYKMFPTEYFLHDYVSERLVVDNQCMVQ